MREIKKYKMEVKKYIPDKMYGFLSCGSLKGDIYFHLGNFDPGKFEGDMVPPILGESVEVDLPLNLSFEGRAPKAVRVYRQKDPERLKGVVKSFSDMKGFGFILGEDNKFYYLHRSEVIDGRVPLVEREVYFYPGSKVGKLRACYVDVSPQRGKK